MAISVKQRMLEKKRKKLERKVLENLGEYGGTEQIFKNFVNQPTPEQYANMFCLSALGGDQNVLLAGGEKFFLEYIFDEFNRAVRARKAGDFVAASDVENRKPGYMMFGSQFEPWGNILTFLDLDKILFPVAEEIRLEDFTELSSDFGNIYVDQKTKSFGFIFSPFAVEKNETAIPPEYLKSIETGELGTPHWLLNPPPKRAGFDGGICRFTSKQIVVFGTIDKLISSLPKRGKHGVQSHERKLASGTTTTVRSHSRTNPIRLTKPDTSAVDHVVYRAFDADGVVRYIGEGKSDRPAHINSGISHNYKINQHHFTRGKMRVEILRDGLSKFEAMAIERFMLTVPNYKDLWNIKDYEPSGDPFRSIVDLDELKEMVQSFSKH